MVNAADLKSAVRRDLPVRVWCKLLRLRGEMVNTPDLGSGAERFGSSSLPEATNPTSTQVNPVKDPDDSQPRIDIVPLAAFGSGEGDSEGDSVRIFLLELRIQELKKVLIAQGKEINRLNDTVESLIRIIPSRIDDSEILDS